MLNLFPAMIFLILFLSSLTFSQTQDSPRLINEFSLFSSEDLTANMESFNIELRQNPNAKGYIIISRAKNSPFGFPVRFKTIMQNFLIEKLQLSLSRFQISITEPGDADKTQIWIVPEGSKLPANDLTRDEFQSDATMIFDRFLYPTKYDGMSCCSIDGYTKFAKNASLSKFAEELEKHPSSKGYIIFYGQYCTDCVSLGTRYFDSLKTISGILRKEKSFLLKQYRLKSSDIIAINGGYRKWQEIELWIVPNNGKAPKLSPSYFPKNRKAVKLKS